MKQNDLLEDTIEYFSVSDKCRKGITYHQRLSENILPISLILITGVFIHYFAFGIETAGLFGVLMFLSGIFFELYLLYEYDYSGRKAVKYYALEMYRDPSEEKLSQLHSWNKNPFELGNEYYYPAIGRIVEEAFMRDDPVSFIEQELPDILRFIELWENKNYNTLVNVNSTDLNLNEEYKKLIQEINYTYKLGAYTSTSILIRKLTDNLIKDILLSKGYYEDLPEEPTLEQKIEILENKVLSEYEEETKNNIINSLNTWIRKKGNKGAHILKEFETEEIQKLMEESQKAVRLLIIIRSKSISDR